MKSPICVLERSFRLLTARFFVFAILIVPLAPVPAWVQTPETHHDHARMSMSAEPLDAAEQARLLSSKHESEFNHHLAGFFLIAAGFLIFAQDTLRGRVAILRYAWPLCFL